MILIRHAEPDAKVSGHCYGSLDVGLSGGGREQAAALAADLATIDVAAIYSSPLRRARETAGAIAAGKLNALVTIDDLRELDFGDCEGRSYDEIAAIMPELYTRWMSAPTTVTFPNGEDFSALSRRSTNAAARIRRRFTGRTSIIVTHGGVCRALLAEALELRAELTFRIDIGYARVTVIDWHGNEPTVRLINGRAPDAAVV
jgi:alpha-ribazole phosphatase